MLPPLLGLPGWILPVFPMPVSLPALAAPCVILLLLTVLVATEPE